MNGWWCLFALIVGILAHDIACVICGAILERQKKR